MGVAPAFQSNDTLKPQPLDPAELNGLFERLMRSNRENNHGGSAKALAVVNRRQADRDLPAYVYNDLKREHLLRTGFVVFDEHYFDNLGGAGEAGAQERQAIAQAFGSFGAWEADFRRIGTRLGGGWGWGVLAFNLPPRQLENCWMADHGHEPAATVPELAMDMYEHFYQMDFAAFFQNLNWDRVAARLDAVGSIKA
ncbi:Fe-Mn family superoxide dismutase [Roseateles sp.]|uniref:Fe-Mn family superoxide dismutase n=1 Tax=Roseateles sp. TaxID=1971397 RepID=UPI0025D9B811|nr:Fe-Mn family superoxide dismutase [Roseateles sp.]MBV8034130.1 superoxide dismutase [Roseateles sp.]